MMSLIDILPIEVISIILSNLSFSEISRCRLVCKKWNIIIWNRHFWQLRIKVILKSSLAMKSLFLLPDRCLKSLVGISYHFDRQDGNVIKNNCFTSGVSCWGTTLGPYQVSSDGIIKTRNKRFLRLQHLLFDEGAITQKLITECNVYLVWSVWISGTQDYPSTFSARLVNRHNKIITTFTCQNTTSSWIKLNSRFLLTDKMDLTQLYYKEIGYCLSCKDSSFTGVQIFDSRIFIDISELVHDT